MWFDDEEVTGRKLFDKKGGWRRIATLKVNVNSSLSKKAGSQQAAAFVLVVFGIIAMTVSSFFGIKYIERRLFSENRDFVIRELDIRTSEDAVLSRELIREYTEIEEGVNMFDVDIKKVRSDFLRRAPNVRAMEITRVLPHTLRIDIRERIPLARIGHRGDLVADGEGCVFVKRSGTQKLPIITGYKGSRLRPGVFIQGLAYAALQVFDVCRDPRYDLRIETISVSKKDYIVIHRPDKIYPREIMFNWSGMGDTGSESRENLAIKLGKLANAMRDKKMSKQKKLDATFDNAFYGS